MFVVGSHIPANADCEAIKIEMITKLNTKKHVFFIVYSSNSVMYSLLLAIYYKKKRERAIEQDINFPIHK